MSVTNPLALGAGLLMLWLVMVILLRPRATANLSQKSVSHRAYRPRGPVYLPLTLGNVTVDLQPTAQDTIHTVIAGISGTGKSTAVLPLYDLPIGVLTVALDNTRPISAKIREIGGIEWTNEPTWGVGLDLLGGHPRTTAEVFVEGWAAKTQGDTGKWRDIAESRLHKALVAMDRTGVPRNVADLADALALRTGNTEADRACQDWAGRLERLADVLGPALGSDLDLVQAMRDRTKVLLRLNRFTNPRLAPMLGGMLLVHARRVADEANIPFILVVEEAGQMGIYEHQLSALAQAGRDRGVPLILLTQNASNLPLEVQNNISVWVSFAQEASRELKFAAERLRLDPEQLLREAFSNQGRGYCYIRAPGRPTTLVHIKPRKSRASYATEPTQSPQAVPSRRRTVVTELAAPLPVEPALPPPPLVVQEILSQIDRSGHCHLWTGRVDRDGYGLVWWEGQNRRVHRIVYELAYGPIPLGPNGKPLDLDHQCQVRRCCRLEHLEPVTRRVNVQRRWRVRGVATAAD